MFRNKSGMSRALVRRETIAGYLFLLPSLFFFLTFVVYPMLMCIFTSFFDSNMGKNTQDVFIGLKNYTELFQIRPVPSKLNTEELSLLPRA